MSDLLSVYEQALRFYAEVAFDPSRARYSNVGGITVMPWQNDLGEQARKALAQGQR